MFAVCRNHHATERRPGEESGEGEASMVQRWSADRNCFSPIRHHYHAPSCSNGSVKCQTGELSVLLCPALRSALTVAKTPPPPLVLTASIPPPSPQRCDCAAKLWLLFLLRVRVRVLFTSPSSFASGAREHFSSRVSEYIVNVSRERRARQLARAEKRQESRRRKGRERREEREKGKEQISVISVDNAVYVASKRNDATFAK